MKQSRNVKGNQANQEKKNRKILLQNVRNKIIKHFSNQNERLLAKFLDAFLVFKRNSEINQGTKGNKKRKDSRHHGK